MKFRVIAILRNASGETTEMQYLKSGDRFTAIQNVMAAMGIEDAPWVELVSIRVEVIEESTAIKCWCGEPATYAKPCDMTITTANVITPDGQPAIAVCSDHCEDSGWPIGQAKPHNWY